MCCDQLNIQNPLLSRSASSVFGSNRSAHRDVVRPVRPVIVSVSFATTGPVDPSPSVPLQEPFTALTRGSCCAEGSRRAEADSQDRGRGETEVTDRDPLVDFHRVSAPCVFEQTGVSLDVDTATPRDARLVHERIPEPIRVAWS
jgi:hypothetical protein